MTATLRADLRALAWWALTGAPLPDALRDDLQAVGACLLMALAPAVFGLGLALVGR